MKFKNDDDSRYFVRFMEATERIIKQLTVKEFIAYLKENAVLEDETREYIDGKGVTCQLYNLKEENSNLHKEFLVTEDDRVFYFRTLNDKIEFEDKKEEIKMNEKYKAECELMKQNIDLGLYDTAMVTFTFYFGKLVAFLELSDFTETERDNETDKLIELFYSWEKRYYSKEDK